VEKDGKAVDGPAYTEVHVRPDGDHLRIGDMVYPSGWDEYFIHPLPEDGLLWFGGIKPDEYFEMFPYTKEIPQEIEEHGEIPQSQVACATSIYLRDCDVVFFTLECSRFRGEYINNTYMTGTRLRDWLYAMNGILVTGQISIPMLVS
jgi:hypothetical protein